MISSFQDDADEYTGGIVTGQAGLADYFSLLNYPFQFVFVALTGPVYNLCRNFGIGYANTSPMSAGFQTLMVSLLTVMKVLQFQNLFVLAQGLYSGVPYLDCISLLFVTREQECSICLLERKARHTWIQFFTLI